MCFSPQIGKRQGRDMLARSRQYIASAKLKLGEPERLRPLRDRLTHLSAYEVGTVERIWRNAHARNLTGVAAAISWLGNGLIYLLLGLPILIFVPGSAPAVLAAVTAMLVAHLLYPWIKLACARERPFAICAGLQPLLKTLDRLSFPSGHLMTLTAASVPILLAFPQFWPGVVAVWLAMAWSRVACAHHFPTDVIAGTALGFTVAIPISWSLLY
jgi:undecaprenyl-diphosphatase